MKNLQGRVCVVTGAAHGVGEALAREFAARGARLVLADVDEVGLKETGAGLPGGAEFLVQRCDVSRAEDVAELARATVERFGAVHVLCNNAGIGVLGSAWGIAPEDWSRVLNVNVMGVVHGLNTFVPMLLAQGEEAHIVNTCSMMGLSTAPMHACYAASKHALLALSETLRDELVGTGKPIGVSLVCPGPVRTRMIEDASAAPGSPEEGTVEMIKTLVREHGMEASEVARQSVEAVLENRFWVLPAPEYFDAEYPRIQQVRASVGLD